MYYKPCLPHTSLAVLNTAIAAVIIALLIAQLTRPQLDCPQDASNTSISAGSDNTDDAGTPNSTDSNAAAVAVFGATAQTLSDAAHDATSP